MSSSRSILAVACVMVILFVGAHLLLPDLETSAAERRTLAEFPTFRWEDVWSGDYMADIETYLADHAPLRDAWVALQAQSNRLLGQKELNGVYALSDRLIATYHENAPSYRAVKWVDALTEKVAIPVYLGLIPTAESIERDRLPQGAPVFDELAYLAGLDTQATVIDVAGALQAHAGEALYYRTDHHWTLLGAAYGTQAMVEAMGGSLPMPEYETLSSTFYGTLSARSGIRSVEADHLAYPLLEADIAIRTAMEGEPEPGTLFDHEAATGNDPYAFYLGGEAPLHILTNPEGEGTLLVIRDSYTNSQAALLASVYEEVHLIDLRYWHSSVAGYAESIGADSILIAMSIPNFNTEPSLAYLAQ